MEKEEFDKKKHIKSLNKIGFFCCLIGLISIISIICSLFVGPYKLTSSCGNSPNMGPDPKDYYGLYTAISDGTNITIEIKPSGATITYSKSGYSDTQKKYPYVGYASAKYVKSHYEVDFLDVNAEYASAILLSPYEDFSSVQVLFVYEKQEDPLQYFLVIEDDDGDIYLHHSESYNGDEDTESESESISLDEWNELFSFYNVTLKYTESNITYNYVIKKKTDTSFKVFIDGDDYTYYYGSTDISNILTWYDFKYMLSYFAYDSENNYYYAESLSTDPRSKVYIYLNEDKISKIIFTYQKDGSTIKRTSTFTNWDTTTL